MLLSLVLITACGKETAVTTTVTTTTAVTTTTVSDAGGLTDDLNEANQLDTELDTSELDGIDFDLGI